MPPHTAIIFFSNQKLPFLLSIYSYYFSYDFKSFIKSHLTIYVNHSQQINSILSFKSIFETNPPDIPAQNIVFEVIFQML